MKKGLSIVCACVLLLAMIPFAVATAAADELAVITIETVTAAPMAAGKTFAVKISSNRIAKVAALEFRFKYDATLLEAVSGKASGWLDELDIQTVNCDPIDPTYNDPTIGEVWITGMALKDKDSASGEVFATVTFKTLKPISENTTFAPFGEILVVKADGTSVPTAVVNGGVRIEKPDPVKITAESSTAAYALKDKIASVAVTAVGDGLSYTWYVKNPGGTKYSKSSITAATYQTKMTPTNSGRRVYCIVKDRYGNEAQSKTFILRMQATVTSVPATAAYAKMGDKVSVAIGAAGDGLTYAWYIKNANGTKYSKSSLTGSTYTTAMSAASKGRRVYCVVKDQYGKTAQTKTFILRESVSIINQPQSVYGAEGTKVSTTVTASGDGLTYVWYVKNAGQTKYTKSSVTGPTYATKMTDASKDRLLSCLVTDQYGNEIRAKTVQLKMK
ncbi:MAG: hypothetical protein IJC52_05520 [Clostridia bacterium]|nr:hypothetical protein [Clostridia bacterium]